MKTILVMAGGTGGHVFPGLAVADYLHAHGWRVVWMGNPEGMEAKLVPTRGYEMAWLRFAALRGKGLLRKLLLPANLLRAFWQALRELGRVRPNVVLGMGGYVTFPGGMMAVLTGRPLVVHEQNSVAGLANRVLAGVADRVLSGFPNVLGQGEWTGNPVRAEIAALPQPAQRYAGRSGRLDVLVVGGSLGAQALNDAVPRALTLITADKRPRVTHQSGAKQIDALRAAYAVAGVEAELLPFIDDMAARYAQADLVICRAGALTVAELAAAGVASVLVPFPHAVDDHQTGNARFLSEAGAAILLPQKELTPEKLAALLGELTRGQLAGMAEKARTLAKPEATRAVAEACMEVAR
ncbi:MAG: undecaprenyldiphospho-muramoylpentapeptide beta-N-acetylglucosaminyltransferase [Rhodocyclaceae bacterium]|jgi:UDP-N-acetylglucosamine--N-acetylmuramyl-(pentapeptide) pyrophosphoryl-undecaprenol N-acetylglucosamine transferase|nr:undecaprenyldiphospho-muramoylpentapeptide beta-N-acetylglucosaminyltransferase [Rhodocyclaceae bacterium]